ncbi:hypothetical protein QNA08_00975 [Chelatococcus sp. SYSU_G07232]|uniref:Uncharacterized protein n=1 Tax=Chelatococcus albus TaxID=3047466 RepID=A0ABT7ACU1_9HYPH|nr:hypothetical protein [Chelatococcus sp. SYSU_G07232]MDJ1156817.1 hypothetical protein [Chelatococcus sp. SYSU_G07232]
MNDRASLSETTVIRDRTPVAVRADNLIRQRLRIGDPRNPQEVAEGLKRLFTQDARKLAAEAEGLPVVPARFVGEAARSPESQATGAELKQAIDDVERDLGALTADHRLKDISAELQGWGQAIRSIISDGTAAARLALDPRARDRLFAARRQLGDYARLARMVGALTQTMNLPYRRLAQSLDEVAGLVLVLAGESLAGAGLGGGRFLLSVPASELQARRDSVLLALRTLAGTTEQAYGNDQWPWGLHGLREMLRVIEASGHLDLRALLEEQVLGRLMDELIERAAQHNVLGLRALGATADVAVQQLHRLLHVVDDRVQPEAPAVTTFLKAIQLFLDAFRSSRSGYRLLFVARAPIAFYGLAGIGGPDPATLRLIDLVVQRGRLAELLDCYLGCDCCGDDVICQILLDKILYDTDRAIDLYTLGSDPDGSGEPEWRAAAFALLIMEFRAPQLPANQANTTCLAGECFPRMGELTTSLDAISSLLRAGKLDAGGTIVTADPGDVHRGLLTAELCQQRLADRRLEALIATLAPGCVPGEQVFSRIESLIDGAIGRLGAPSGTCAEIEIAPPPTTESALELFHGLNQHAARWGLVPPRFGRP